MRGFLWGAPPIPRRASQAIEVLEPQNEEPIELPRFRPAMELYESQELRVVLGRSCSAERDVHMETCAAERVAVVRRESGGGTILLGPGCLVYSVHISLQEHPAYTSIERSYELLLGELIRVLDLPDLTIEGSDVFYQGRKFSGNAQRRTRNHLLHHGTILYETFDLTDIERLLCEPARQPAHRNGKTHAQFLTKLPLTKEELTKRLKSYSPPI